MQDRVAFYDSAYVFTGHYDDTGHPELKKALTDRDQVVRMAANGIYSAVFQFLPDLVFIVSAFFVPLEVLEVLRDRRVKIVMLYTESPYEEKRQIEKARYADLAVLNDPLNLAMYDDAGIPALYSPHAYRPMLHYPGPGEDDLETDFAFAGTGYPGRVRFFERMHELGAFDGIDVTLAGNWQQCRPQSPLMRLLSHDPNECVENELTARVYRSAKAGMNLYRDEPTDNGQRPVACGPREIEMAASGLFFLRDPGPESDELFPMLPTFAGPEDAAEQLRWWLAHDTAREEAALKARAAVRHRTFGASAARLLEALAEI
jgi:spore maturation protein CgeB